MSFGHAIYYPHINLTNKNWLKYALLFWDKISRIVPKSVSPSDSEDVIKIRSEVGFIEDYHPESRDTSQAARDFFAWFSHQIEDPCFLDYYDHMLPEIRDMLKHSSGWRRHGRYPHPFAVLNAIAREQGTYVHVEKLDPRLKEYLYLTGVAMPGENEWSDWVKIDGEIGLLYMSYLAGSIGEHTSRPTVTDYSACFASSSVLRWAVKRRYQEELEHGLGNLLLASYAPKDMNAVTIDKIVEFRKKYDNERIVFFDSVAAICRDIASVENEGQLQDALNHHGPTLKKHTEDLKKQFEDMRIEPILRFIGISIPTACASMIKYIPDAVGPFIIGGGVLLGFASATHSYFKDRKALQDNPLSYLLTLQAELNAKGFLEKIANNIQGITR
jgi:hypothetical protein